MPVGTLGASLAGSLEQGPDKRERQDQEDDDYDREFHAIFRSSA